MSCVNSVCLGQVKTNRILFIAAGAFHNARLEDMYKELRARFQKIVEIRLVVCDTGGKTYLVKWAVSEKMGYADRKAGAGRQRERRLTSLSRMCTAILLRAVPARLGCTKRVPTTAHTPQGEGGRKKIDRIAVYILYRRKTGTICFLSLAVCVC